jgi:NitT/TauT family transport system substrate-binding protein
MMPINRMAEAMMHRIRTEDEPKSSGGIAARLAGQLLAAALAVLPMAASAEDLTKVVLRTDYRFNGYDAPFALALERGWYRQAGLDVEIGAGQGSATTVQTVAAGTDTFGLADSATVIRGVSSMGIPVKIVSVYTQTGVNGMIYHQNSGFDGKLANIRGKVLISSPGAAELTLLPAALAIAGMTTDDVELRLVDLNARIPLFLQTPGSIDLGFATGELLRIRSKLPTAQYTPFAAYGVISYGIALVTSDATIRDKREMVRKFVAASAMGWEQSAKDLDAAVKASLKLFPDEDPQLLREGLRISVEQQLHTPATAGKPIGWTAESDWTAMAALLQKYAKLTPKPPAAYYTNEFVTKP